MPVLKDRRKLTKENLLILRPYILWKRRKEHLLEARLIAEIKQEEEKRIREEDDKKRQAEEQRKERDKELQDELINVKDQRQALEDKLVILQKQKHELFLKLKTVLMRQETQRKQKYTKESPAFGQMERSCLAIGQMERSCLAIGQMERSSLAIGQIERSGLMFPGITTMASLSDISVKASEALTVNIEASPVALPTTPTYARSGQNTAVLHESPSEQCGGASAASRTAYGFYPHPRTPQPKTEHNRQWTTHLSPHAAKVHSTSKPTQGRSYKASQQPKTPTKHN